uniref:Xylose isomerase domain protein TIM barrel n=1 Tax=Solibacter usitatus (strain Ellin6076) TaxID=234267 RepID=Q027F7_SOLUE
MLYTRRDLGKLAVAAGTAGRLLASKPSSNFGGVQIGAITYSFRALPASAEETLKYCVECGISAIELMSNVPEGYAGAPAPAGRGGGGRAQMTPEQQAAMRKSAEDTKAWRLSVSMDKYKAFRKMYEDAGVKIYAFKLPPTMSMSDQEYEYIWNVGETLGANHITMELPANDELLQRVAAYAAKRKLRIAFHTHGQGGDSGFDKALGASPYTALNLDVGHYYGVNGKSPVPVIEKYHDRIASLHLKDRKGPNGAGGKSGPGGGGPNMPWGQGETPLKDVLLLMKKQKYKFPGSIEYEYDTPEGSDVLTEVKKCVQFCRTTLT